MTRLQATAAAGFVAVTVAYAALSGTWVSTQPGWYASLPQPSWQPPPWIFGVMWPLNFLALAVSGVALAVQRPASESLPVLGVLGVSVAFALSWAYLFYVPHRLGAAALCLGIAAALTWLVVILAAGSLPWAGWLLVPYGIWMVIATTLSVAYWRLVR